MIRLSYILNEAWKRYEVSNDPKKQLYDFYVLSSLSTLPLSSADKGFSGNLIGRDPSDIKLDIEHASDKLFPVLSKKLKAALFFGICAEAYHVFDKEQDFSKLKSNSLFKAYFKNHLLQKGDTNYSILNPTRGIEGPSRVEANRISYLTAFKVARKSIKESGSSDEKFVIMAKEMFLNMDWFSAYGGKNWANICDGYLLFLRADTKQKMQVAIDHAYDLEHNTGSALNKVKDFFRDNGDISWLAISLDHKRDIKDFYSLLPHCSSDLRRLAYEAFKVANVPMSKSINDKNKSNNNTSGEMVDSTNNPLNTKDTYSIKNLIIYYKKFKFKSYVTKEGELFAQFVGINYAGGRGNLHLIKDKDSDPGNIINLTTQSTQFTPSKQMVVDVNGNPLDTAISYNIPGIINKDSLFKFINHIHIGANNNLQSAKFQSMGDSSVHYVSPMSKLKIIPKSSKFQLSYAYDTDGEELVVGEDYTIPNFSKDTVFRFIKYKNGFGGQSLFADFKVIEKGEHLSALAFEVGDMQSFNMDDKFQKHIETNIEECVDHDGVKLIPAALYVLTKDGSNYTVSGYCVKKSIDATRPYEHSLIITGSKDPHLEINKEYFISPGGVSVVGDIIGSNLLVLVNKNNSATNKDVFNELLKNEDTYEIVNYGFIGELISIDSDNLKTISLVKLTNTKKFDDALFHAKFVKDKHVIIAGGIYVPIYTKKEKKETSIPCRDYHAIKLIPNALYRIHAQNVNGIISKHKIDDSHPYEHTFKVLQSENSAFKAGQNYYVAPGRSKLNNNIIGSEVLELINKQNGKSNHDIFSQPLTIGKQYEIVNYGFIGELISIDTPVKGLKTIKLVKILDYKDFDEGIPSVDFVVGHTVDLSGGIYKPVNVNRSTTKANKDTDEKNKTKITEEVLDRNKLKIIVGAEYKLSHASTISGICLENHHESGVDPSFKYILLIQNSKNSFHPVGSATGISGGEVELKSNYDGKSVDIFNHALVVGKKYEIIDYGFIGKLSYLKPDINHHEQSFSAKRYILEKILDQEKIQKHIKKFDGSGNFRIGDEITIINGITVPEKEPTQLIPDDNYSTTFKLDDNGGWHSQTPG